MATMATMATFAVLAALTVMFFVKALITLVVFRVRCAARGVIFLYQALLHLLENDVTGIDLSCLGRLDRG